MALKNPAGKKFFLMLVFTTTVSVLFAQWDGTKDGGVPFISSAPEETTQLLVSDGSNGAIVITQSLDVINFSISINAQRISQDGVVQWTGSSDPKNVISISDEITTLKLLAAVADGSGGAYITWQKNSDTFSNVYLQRINSSGNRIFADTGIMLNSNYGIGGEDVKLVSDGSGGVVASWTESIYDAEQSIFLYSKIFAQRFSGTGTRQWAAGNVNVSTDNNLRWGPSLVNDGAGGFIIFFTDARNGSQLPGFFTGLDIYAQRIVGSNGTISWNAAGVAVATAPVNEVTATGFDGTSCAVADGAGGAVLFFKRDVPTDFVHTKLSAQKVNSAGVVQWGSAGVPVFEDNGRFPPYSSEPIKISGDGSGGLIAAWKDPRNAPPGKQRVYMQRVLSNGTVNWTVDGVDFIPLEEEAAAFDFAPDGNGNYILAWATAQPAVKAQKINNSGVVQWVPFGKTVCNNQLALPSNPSVVRSNAGAAIISWVDSRNGFFNFTDIYVNKMTAAGSLVNAVEYITNSNGNWNSGATWIGGQVPPTNADVIIRHNVNITADASCNSVSVEKPNGKITVGTNIKLAVLK